MNWGRPERLSPEVVIAQGEKLRQELEELLRRLEEENRKAEENKR